MPDSEVRCLNIAQMRELAELRLDRQRKAEARAKAAEQRAQRYREALERALAQENTRIKCRCEGRHDEFCCLGGSIALDRDEKMEAILRAALTDPEEER